MNEKMTRREIVKGILYVAPAILTLKALPAFAQNGSNHVPGFTSDSKSQSDSSLSQSFGVKSD